MSGVNKGGAVEGAEAPVEYHRGVESVALFSDAIFAIAMTLLVVGIAVPSSTTTITVGHALRGLGSSFASYATSFLVTGLYWIGYHRQMHYMERFDGGALVLNLVFLMSVAFLPFPTHLLNHYFGSVAVVFYASSIAATGVLLAILWLYAARRGLLRDADERLRTYFALRALFVPLVFLLSIPVAVVGPSAAVYLWLLVFLGRPVLRRLVYR